MNHSENDNRITLDSKNNPILSMNKMTISGSKHSVFKDQWRAFRHGCQGKNLLLHFRDKIVCVFRTVNTNIIVNFSKVVLGVPSQQNLINFWHF